MKKAPISLIIGGASILVTILLYFVILGNRLIETICLITLIGVVLAEVIATVFAYISKGDPRKVASAVISVFLVPIAVVLSIVYIVNFPTGYLTYAGIYLVCLIIVVAISAVLSSFSAHKNAENNELQNAKANMLALREIVHTIMIEPAAKQYKVDLNKLEEKLHFSKDNVVTTQDEVIYGLLVELQNNIGNPSFDVKAAISKINYTIDRRNILAKH